MPAPVFDPKAVRRSILEGRVVGEVGLEPTKLTQRIYSPPPLPLGTFPQRAGDEIEASVPAVKPEANEGVP